MPIMDVRYPAGRLDKAAKASLAVKLTDVLIRMEGGANTCKGRAFAWVLFNEMAQQDLWVGGRADAEFVSAPGAFFVRVLIPEGYMNAAHKSEVHAWVTQAILDTAAGDVRAVGESVLVVIEEVKEGNWGAGGATISFNSIAESVGLSRASSRYLWTQDYFAAKARSLALGGYPKDVGGVPPTLDPDLRASA
jgi:phenylpyruvate tautomerase PptA (4-oxalocrotonate tautomerase family)